jgi:hypothetical protein
MATPSVFLLARPSHENRKSSVNGKPVLGDSVLGSGGTGVRASTEKRARRRAQLPIVIQHFIETVALAGQRKVVTMSKRPS